jgi:hypothetical protein
MCFLTQSFFSVQSNDKLSSAIISEIPIGDLCTHFSLLCNKFQLIQSPMQINLHDEIAFKVTQNIIANIEINAHVRSKSMIKGRVLCIRNYIRFYICLMSCVCKIICFNNYIFLFLC